MIKEIANTLLLDEQYINKIADTASFRYKKLKIRRNNKVRIVYAPSTELKAIQRGILDFLYDDLELHNCSYAYRRRRTIYDCVAVHKESRFFLRMDFKNFFYSITKDDMRNYFCAKSLYQEEIESLLKIFCFHDRLVIGSVTSPILSNALMYEFDERVLNYCQSNQFEYSRYADDIFFSTKKKELLFQLPRQIDDILKTLTCPSNLRINKKKTHHTSHKRLVSFLGINITNDGKISIGREMKRKIRVGIYKWDSLSAEDKMKLQGSLSYYRSIEPDFLNTLYIKHGSSRINEIIHFDHDKYIENVGNESFDDIDIDTILDDF